MYGTVYRMQPRQGQDQAVLDHLFRWEQEYLPGVIGYAGGYILEPASLPTSATGSIVVIVVFDSLAAYIRTRDDPEQNLWYQRLRDLVEHDPEWNEGEVTEIFGEARGL
jgi:hypothetical protein